MKTVFSRCLFLGLLFIHGACRQLVDHDFPEFEAKPVINSFLIAEQEMAEVQVSLAGKISNTPLSGEEQAQVSLYRDGVYFGHLQHQSQGIYRLDSLIAPNHTYECRVEVPGFEPLRAQCQLPSATQVLSIEHISAAGRDEEGQVYPAIKIRFTNNPNQRHYFQVIIHLANGWGSQAQLEKITDPVLLREGLPIALFSNQAIQEEEYTLTLNYTSGGSTMINDVWYTSLYPLQVEFRTVSEEYYQYVKHLYLYNQGRYPYVVGGVIQYFPLYSNVEQGYGIFAGYSTIVSDTIRPEPYVF